MTRRLAALGAVLTIAAAAPTLAAAAVLEIAPVNRLPFPERGYVVSSPDGAALDEARAGALLAGSAFVRVNVTTKAVDSLNAKFGAVQDPAVIVLRPPGSLVVRIDGFADRDTVAQAALNAAA